jgi:hypothetical protein
LWITEELEQVMRDWKVERVSEGRVTLFKVLPESRFPGVDKDGMEVLVRTSAGLAVPVLALELAKHGLMVDDGHVDAVLSLVEDWWVCRAYVPIRRRLNFDELGWVLDSALRGVEGK